MPRRFVKIWQNHRLKKLVRHFAEKVPLYSRIMREIDIPPKKFKGIVELTHLPIIDKNTFRKRSASDYINALSQEHLVRKQTSGSTGAPFEFVIHNFPLPNYYHDFLGYRSLIWQGISLQKIMLGLRMVHIRLTPFKHSYRLFIPVQDIIRNKAVAFSKISNFSPEVIESFPSVLLELAKYMSSREINVLNPKFIISYGEKLFPATRRYIEKLFQCTVYDRYGMEEFGAIGQECGYQTGFHINEETLLIEIVDDNGFPTPPGVAGNIIITDLYNFNMPFIRYHTGDYGRLDNTPCPCGVASPRLHLAGRVASFINTRVGKIHHFEFADIMNHYSAYVMQYQIVSRSSGIFEIRIVPFEPIRYDLVSRLKLDIKKLTNNTSRFVIRLVDYIEPMANGKRKTIVNIR